MWLLAIYPLTVQKPLRYEYWIKHDYQDVFPCNNFGDQCLNTTFRQMSHAADYCIRLKCFNLIKDRKGAKTTPSPELAVIQDMSKFEE